MPPSRTGVASGTADAADDSMAAQLHGPVLVATDATEDSLPALEMARLLGAHGATLDLIAVIEPLRFPTGEFAVDWAEIDSDRRDQLERRVKQQVADTLEDVEPATIRAVLGLAVPEIAGMARARHSALVVTGLRHHTGFERVFLRGETPLRIARAARVPVLVVPTHVTRLPRIVMIATDLDEASVNAARFARPLLAEATAVHIVHVRNLTTLPGGDAGAPWGALYSTLTSEIGERVRAALRPPPNVHVEVRTLTGHPVDELIEYGEYIGVELIVMGYRDRRLVDRITGPRSVAERVYRGTSAPMLLVPESAQTGDESLAQTDVLTEPSEWAKTLAAFTSRNGGRQARLEIHTTESGSQAEVAGFPFRGADYEHTTDTVHLVFGPADEGTPHLAHGIVQPQCLEIRHGSDGRDVFLRVPHRAGYTLLAFD